MVYAIGSIKAIQGSLECIILPCTSQHVDCLTRMIGICDKDHLLNFQFHNSAVIINAGYNCWHGNKICGLGVR